MKKTAIFAITIILGAAVIYFWPINMTPKTVPNISVNTIDGRIIDFSNLPEKPLLVTFWATTCSQCMKEIPHLVKLYNELKLDGFEIISIAMSYDPPNRVVAFSRQKNIPYTIALDIDGNVARAFGNVSLTPTSFLISPAGEIIQKDIGTIDLNNLRQKIKRLLEQGKTNITWILYKENALV